MRRLHLRALRAFGTLAALALSGSALVYCGGSSGGGGGNPDGSMPNDSGPGEASADAPQGNDAADGSAREASPGDAGDAGDAADATIDGAADARADADATAPVDAASEEEPEGGAEAGDGGDGGDGAIPCDAASACTGSLSCCSGLCTDLGHDPRNCGACGNACNATQFCTGTQCDNAVFSNVGANAAITVVEDPYPIDIEAGVAIGNALGTLTDGGVVVVPQTQPGVLIPEGDAGWRPNTGVGTTLVAGGSWFGQLSVAYMDNSGLTPVYLTNDGTTSHIYQRSTGLAVVTVADSALTNSHDYFILELAVEPQSGTLCLFGQGILAAGTVAAGYWGSQMVVPNNATYTSPWYVYEWTDTNGDGTPDQGDTFDLVAQG